MPEGLAARSKINCQPHMQQGQQPALRRRIAGLGQVEAILSEIEQTPDRHCFSQSCATRSGLARCQHGRIEYSRSGPCYLHSCLKAGWACS